MFILFGIGYYVLTIIIIIVVLAIINKKTKQKYTNRINDLVKNPILIKYSCNHNNISEKILESCYV